MAGRLVPRDLLIADSAPTRPPPRFARHPGDRRRGKQSRNPRDGKHSKATGASPDESQGPSLTSAGCSGRNS